MHTQTAYDEHELSTKIRDQSYKPLAEEWRFHNTVLEEQIIHGEPATYFQGGMVPYVLKHEIVEDEYKRQHIPLIFLEGDAKL